jgi:AraC-like DNA-binding protein
MGSEAALPSLAFSTGDLPAEERLDAWRDLISPVLDIEVLEQPSPRPCRADMAVVHLGQLLVSRISLAGIDQRGVRAPRKIRRDALDHYVVEVYRGGGCTGEIGGGAFDLSPGGVGIMDLGQPLAVRSALSDSVALNIPRALLDRHVPDAARLHGTVLRGGLGDLLGDYILSLYRHLPRLSANEAARVSQATVSMIAACLAPSADNLARARGPVDSVLLERAKRFISRNLASPDLSVGRICAVLRVSRSHLYRAFEPQGGVAGYIQGRRLANVRAALLDSADGRRISALAYDHGFTSAAHFSRAFRQRFGLTPSDARQRARERTGERAGAMHAAAGVASSGGAIGNWLRNLAPADG